MKSEICFTAFFFSVFSFLLVYADSEKKVYVYSRNGNARYYAHWTRDSFERIFKEFEVIPVASLKNLSDFAYVVTEETPEYDQEFQCLSHYPKEKVLLFVHETSLYLSRSHDKSYHEPYSKIFTWNDDLVDNKKYFKILTPWCAYWYNIADLPKFEDRKFSVFIGHIDPYGYNGYGNYDERGRLIDFFEQKSSDDFHFYGLSNELGHRASYRNYRGSIPGGPQRTGCLSKVNLIKNYRFDFCYENTKNVNGFITERIFQSLSAGCIPVYSGIKNLATYIPKNCFIALSDFASYEELYKFIKNMSKETYEEYRENIKKFVASDAAYRMSTPYYIRYTREILGLDKAN